MSRYRRVMLKLSGQALGGAHGELFNNDRLRHIVHEILTLTDMGVEVATMVGGGNVFRGDVSTEWSIDRAEADNIGMLGTIINGVMLRAALTSSGDQEVRLMSAINIPAMAEPYIRLKADSHLAKGWIVLLTGGIGQPYVTTDYPSVQRAIELRCDAVLAAKHGIDGVFDSDPRVHADARRYASLSLDQAVQQRLGFMDQSALVLARDHRMPVHVFNFDNEGSMAAICRGTDVGTFVGLDAASRLADAG